jgi:iron complex transport system substrate-binding protein
MTAFTLDETLKKFETAPQRVVSLVPSYTESLFDLGFGKSVVGITDYCIHPGSELEKVPRVGGPKNPRIADIMALHPDLVLCNQEENSLETALALDQAGICVWSSFPKSIQDLIEVLWGMDDLYRDETASIRLRFLEDSVNWARITAQDLKPFQYFCPVWQEKKANQTTEWITFNQDTYMDDLLSLFGGINVFRDQVERYPHVSLEAVISNAVEVVILPDDPYLFQEADSIEMMQWLRDTPAGISGRICLVDGSLVTWCGTRLGKALNELADYFAI